MTMGVFDFKAIKRKLDCQEQKADFEEKNPKVDPNKIVWSPEWGYGMAAPFGLVAEMESHLDELREKIDAVTGISAKYLKA